MDELANWVQKQGGQLSVRALDLGSAAEVGGHQAERALNPASNMKLLTAAVALDLLGPGFVFQTGLYGEPNAQQIRTLVLRGNGDPSLRTHDVWRLANVIANLGITKVDQLLVDQSRFDDQFVPPAFGQQPNEWATFRAPVSAIAVERNAVTLNVLPSQPGAAANVWFEPPGVVALDGAIQTRAAGSGQRIEFKLLPEGMALSAKLDGHISPGVGRQRFSRRVDNPLLLPGLVLKALLQQRGVEVGDVQLGGKGEKRRITYHASAKLGDLVQELGKRSDNFYAEMLFKAVATTLPSSDGGALQGSSAAGAVVVRDWLAAITSLSAGTRITNGSGLFDANRISARELVEVLAHAYGSPRLRHEFISQLSIGGFDGTLRARFRPLGKSRRVRAKTGTLRRAVSLSGFVLREGTGAPIAFSFLVTGIDGQHAAIRQRIDAAVSELAKL